MIIRFPQFNETGGNILLDSGVSERSVKTHGALHRQVSADRMCCVFLGKTTECSTHHCLQLALIDKEYLCTVFKRSEICPSGNINI